jgi:NADH:ubiquinone oxidoreductase subunit C
LTDFDSVVSAIKGKFSDSAVAEVNTEVTPPIAVVDSEKVYDILSFLKSEDGGHFELLMNLSATDFLPQVKKPAPKPVPKPAPKPEENKAGDKGDGGPDEATPEPEKIPGRMEMVYHLFSFTNNLEITIKVILDRDKPEIDSVTPIWPGANWQERETYDLLGVYFNNHPDLRRILCPSDWEGHPLKKDYQVQKTWRGIVVDPKSKMNPWLRNQ